MNRDIEYQLERVRQPLAYLASYDLIINRPDEINEALLEVIRFAQELRERNGYEDL